MNKKTKITTFLIVIFERVFVFSLLAKYIKLIINKIRIIFNKIITSFLLFFRPIGPLLCPRIMHDYVLNF